MRRPLPTARQMPTILKAGLELESTMPAADVLADAVVDVVEDAEVDEDIVLVHVQITEKLGCALNKECVLSSSEREASGEVTVKSTARGDIAALLSAVYRPVVTQVE